MKLSTSGFARGRTATIVSLIVMGILSSLAGEKIGVTLVCLSGAVTWFLVVAVLNANKDKNVF